MADLTRKQRAYLRRLTQRQMTREKDKSHWFDSMFQRLYAAGYVLWLTPTTRRREVVITDAGRAALERNGDQH